MLRRQNPSIAHYRRNIPPCLTQNIRRIFELFQNYLKEHGVKEEQIMTVNLEDGDFRHIRTSNDLFEYVESRLIKNQKNYIFLDEVQQVTNFQEGVDWLYAKKL
jgi:predicted AAA+ superfamily ATPase